MNALRKEIMRLMREDFDPTPNGWEGREWYDNAEDVATRIEALFPTNPSLGWQDISTAPKDGTWVFCRWPMMRIGMFPLVVFWDAGWFPAHDYARDYGEVFPTHWMPLTPFEETTV